MAVAGQNTRRLPARPENYCESKQAYFSYSLDKAFHSPEFQAKLFFTRNWVGGFYWDSLLKCRPYWEQLQTLECEVEVVYLSSLFPSGQFQVF